MRKTLCLLSVVLLLLSVAGCAENTYSPLPKEYSPIETVCFVTEKKEYPKGVKEINFSIRNDGEEDIWIEGLSECYTLHKKIDGEWMEVDFKEREMIMINMPPSLVKSTEEKEDSIETDLFKAPLDCGEYRVALRGYEPMRSADAFYQVFSIKCWYVSESFFIVD